MKSGGFAEPPPPPVFPEAAAASVPTAADAADTAAAPEAILCLLPRNPTPEFAQAVMGNRFTCEWEKKKVEEDLESRIVWEILFASRLCRPK